MTTNLIPVIELVPAQYQQHPLDGPKDRSPEAWLQYWKASLAQAGITELDPLFSGSWDVPIAGILPHRAFAVSC